MELADCALDGVFGFAEVLILVNSGREIEGKVHVNDVVNGICKGFFGVEEVELVRSDGGTDVVRWCSSQWTSVDRVA